MADNTLKTRIILRNDSTANWLTNKDQVLKRGEVGVEFDEKGKTKIKIGNGTATWENLPYFGGQSEEQVFQVDWDGTGTKEAAITAAVGAAELQAGDVAIVKQVIYGEKKEYTAFVYDGTNWVAMDGNYSAENVYFAEDFIATQNIGTVTIDSTGSATIAAKGKNVKEVLAALFAKEKDPTVTAPKVTVTSTDLKAYEAGTKIKPKYTATFDAGKYQYGPATGVTATEWEVTLNDTVTQTLTTATGTFEEITVGDNSNITITAKATHGAGAAPKTNLGNEKASLAIAAGTKSATTTTKITSFRPIFYGVSTTDTAIDGDAIRALTNGGIYNAAKNIVVKVGEVAGAKRVILAYPASTSRGGLTKVELTSTMNLDITSTYVAQANVEVPGANGYTAVPYKVFVYAPAEIGGDEVHTIKLA